MGSRCGDSSVLVLASSSEVLIPVKTTFCLFFGGAEQAEIQKLVSTLDDQCGFATEDQEIRIKNKTKQKNSYPTKALDIETAKLI